MRFLNLHLSNFCLKQMQNWSVMHWPRVLKRSFGAHFQNYNQMFTKISLEFLHDVSCNFLSKIFIKTEIVKLGI